MSYAFTRDVPAGEGHYAEVRCTTLAPAPGSSTSTALTSPRPGDHRHTLPPAKTAETAAAVASRTGASPMPSQTLPADAGRPEPGTQRTPVPPTACSAGEPDCGGNPAEAAARQRIARARAWQWRAGLSGDLCEHRSATAALQRACDELAQVSTIALAARPGIAVSTALSTGWSGAPVVMGSAVRAS